MAKTYRVKISSIDWDCDDKKIKRHLPKMMTLEITLDDDEVDLENDDDVYDILCDSASDKISDETGWCHNGFADFSYSIV